MALRDLATTTDEEDAKLHAAALADPDNPPLTREIAARLRPAEEADPELVAAYREYRRTRGPQKAPTKRQVTLRLDGDVVEHFRKDGPGWQRRINDTLRKAARLPR